MSDHAWLELCEVPECTLEAIEARPFDAVCLQFFGCARQDDPELTTLVLQVVPSSRLSENNKVHVHPLLYEFLAAAIQGIPREEDDRAPTSLALAVAPLPLEGYDSVMEEYSTDPCWKLSRQRNIVDLPSQACISLICVYSEGDTSTLPQTLRKRQLSIALEGRLVRRDTTIALPSLSGLNVVVVSDIQGTETGDVYRVGNSRDFTIKFTDRAHHNESRVRQTWPDQECPGYTDLLLDLIKLSQLTGAAAPAGILLTGCVGVGKSRLASCLAHHTSQSTMTVHWVSAQDLIVRASWALESDLLELLLPPSNHERCLIVLDDLHVLESQDQEAYRDPELVLVQNSILQALDHLSRVAPSPFILGICHVALNLPKELVRIGRLEKHILMPPPSRMQREDILASILEDVKDEQVRGAWVEALAPQTAGCVAADLRRLCADAWTRAWAWSRSQDSVDIKWSDLREAARVCVPSQLAQLDVTKTTYPHDDGTSDWLKVHEWSWRSFGGYQGIKKRLFRTVVMPWRRLVHHGEENFNDKLHGIAPPSGVLFHGPSGCGKTLAASCLASSLEINIVKVRASDILDQWLGGSEAAIRSLFWRARAASPCILFIDEVDAIACNREDEESSVDVTSRVLSTLLNELDGISSGTAGGVLVVACTNRVEALDAALLRPGRLDEHVLLQMPDVSDVRAMLQIHLEKVPLADDVDTNELAELLAELNASCADAEGVCRDACSSVIRKASHVSGLAVSRADLIAAIRSWRK